MTLLIKNVLILGSPRGPLRQGASEASEAGGGQEFPEKRDVFVTGDKISAIGDFGNKKADEIIDGQGAYLSPGFIDVNTDSDHYLSLLDHPQQEDFLRQGVTTIVGGMCGSSLAPLLYGSLESVQKWGDVRKVNVGWHSVAEFLATLDKLSLGVNFATLVGHSTVRRALVGDNLRDLSKNELHVLGGVLERSLKEGAFGLSTGLGYVHGSKTPYSEIKYLAEIVKKYNGVYATHLRKSGPEFKNSVDETIKLAKETGAKTLISHFMPFRGTEKAYGEALREIRDLPHDMDFNFDLYPFDASVLPIYTFLPAWAQNGGKAVMLRNIKDDWLSERIVKDLPEINSKDFILAQAPGNDFLVGKTLEELSEIFNTENQKRALIKLMASTELRGVVFYKNINANLIRRAIENPRSLIASNAAAMGESEKVRILKPERALGTFTKFLKMAASDGIMPLGAAVKKITRDPAQKFNIKGRGSIKEGDFADIVVFRFNEVVPDAEGTSAEKEKNVEIECVVVNGVVAFKKSGGVLERRGGRVLRHGSAPKA